MHPIPLELLAPARNAETARQAILHGADAVYIGGPSHGARAAASNSIDDISALTGFAHLYSAKVYVTLNTIIFENELPAVERTIRDLYNAGVDALIVQDMSILRMDIPPIDLHASTQCDIRTPQKACFLASVGYSQLVLPREFSLSQIEEVRKAVPEDVKLEAFVHGALCVSYSGDCQASWLAKGRSANRGECAQMCRMAYSLTDVNDNVLVKDKHLLSLRDLCRINDIPRLAEAGISSFKIEGRLKDTAYVKNTVAAYRQAIDRLINDNPGKYRRASYGNTEVSFSPDLDKTFNRGYTSYFLNGCPASAVSMANIDTPKWVGEKVATVVRCEGKNIIIKPLKTLNNGDGLGYFNSDGKYAGFHLNRAEGNTLYTLSPLSIKRGTTLYRNRDIKNDTLLEGDTAIRRISVTAELSITLNNEAAQVSSGTNLPTPESCTLTLTAENGVIVSAASDILADAAKTPQKPQREKILKKLGATSFTLTGITDNIDDAIFIPASVLTRLRQKAVADLEDAIIAGYKRIERRQGHDISESPDSIWHEAPLSYHGNVSNTSAAKFYTDHNAKISETALETSTDIDRRNEITVMTTRYCIRRELGCCLKDRKAKTLPSPLYISNESAKYRLDFDCANCQMHVVYENFLRKNCENKK